MAVMAAQTVVSENYARDPEAWNDVRLDTANPGEPENFLEEIQALSEAPGDIQSIVIKSGEVTALSYENGKVTCEYHSSSEGDVSDEDVEEGYTVSTND